MEAIASTDGRYLISSVAPLLIQSHPPVQCSMILLIFTNVFVAVIDFRFFSVLYSTKRIRSSPKPEFHFLSALYEPAALCSICRVLLQSSYFFFFWGGGGGGSGSHAERLLSQSASYLPVLAVQRL